MFAARPFDRGDKILALDTSRVVSEANPLRPERGESEDHLAFLEEGTVVFLPEPERHLNHRCDPNAFLRTVGEELPARFQREYLPLLEEWFVEKHSDEVAKLESGLRGEV